MSNSTVPDNSDQIRYRKCEPWCEYRAGILDAEVHQDYCVRAVGRAVLTRNIDDVTYEITASQAHLRLPVASSMELEGHANRYHRYVVQLVAIPDDRESEILVLNVRPGAARSLAAILVRAADLTEGLGR